MRRISEKILYVVALHSQYTGALTFENVWQEAVEGSGYFDTIKECYQQSVRWQWGAVDVGYLLVQSVSKWDVPILKRLHLLFTAYDHHLLVVVINFHLQICLVA